MRDFELANYYHGAASWAKDRSQAERRSLRIAWIVAGTAAVIVVLEALALVLLMPLKTVVPYTLLVDRQTGYVQVLKPLERDIIAPDAALVRSFLVQYVIAREGFDIDSLKADYRKVALWSAGTARSSYIATMGATNPASPLATLPRRTLIQVEIRSISSLDANSALVRFSTRRMDDGKQGRRPDMWAAVVRYRFSGAEMSAADRFINPLGFQVLRYQRDAEILPLNSAVSAQTSLAPPSDAKSVNSPISNLIAAPR